MLTSLVGEGSLPDPAVLFAPLAGYRQVGLAVSGGPDSFALMLLAAKWAGQQTPPVPLVVYTVDHGLRPEAAAEAAFVALTAEELGLVARILRWTGAKPKSGLQAAARQARYRLIGAAMAEDGTDVLATAHHAHDQAETLLMRLAHGSGLSGLGAMAAFASVEGVTVCRPLLGVAPGVLGELVAEAGLEAIADPSNHNEDFERVRWRGVLPVLANLGLDAGRFALFAKRARRADAALQQMAHETYAKLAISDGFGTIRIERAAFAALPAELQVRIVRLALSDAGGGQKPFGLQQVEALVTELAAPHALFRNTLMGCSIDCAAEAIIFLREPLRVAQTAHQLVPGGRLCWDQRFIITNLARTDIEIRPGADLTRQQAEATLGRMLPVPMAAIHAAPVVRGGDGEILAIGAMVLNAAIELRFLGVAGSNQSETT